MSLILFVGLPAEMASWVEARLPGVKTEVLKSPAEVDSALRREPAQLLLVDHGLPEQSGVGLLDLIQRSGLPLPPVFYCLPNLSDFALSFRLTQEFNVKRLLVHPLDPEELVRCLRKHLHLAPTAQPPPQVQGRLKQLWEKHSVALLEQARALAEVTESDLEDEGRRTYLVKCAHQLAGSVATFGFPNASEMARVVEHSLLDGNPPAQSVQARGTAILQMLRGTDRMLVSPAGERLEQAIGVLRDLARASLEGSINEQQLALARSEAAQLRVILGLFEMPGLITAACAAEALLQGDLLEGQWALRLAELVHFMQLELRRRGTIISMVPEVEISLWTEPGMAASELATVLRLHGIDVTCVAGSDFDLAPVARPVVVEYRQESAAQFDLVLSGLQEGGRQVVVYAQQADPDLRRRATGFGVKAIFERSAHSREMVEYLKSLVSQSGVKLLAVDDDPALLGILTDTLAEAGYRVSGEREPLLLWQRLEEVNPDLLILDLEMPQVSGLELCKLVRSHPRYASLPILILTGVRDADVVESLFRAGADDYVLKPVVGNDLARRIQERIQRPARNWNAVQSGRQGNSQLALARVNSVARLAERFGLNLCVFLIRALSECQDGLLEERLLRSLQPGDLLARWNDSTRLVAWLGVEGPVARERLQALLSGQPWQASALLCLPSEGPLGPAIHRLEESLRDPCSSPFSDEIVLVGQDSCEKEAVNSALGRDGLRLRWLSSLAQAWTWLEQQDLTASPQVVLLDVQMSEGGGYELLRMMLEKGFLARHRVILLTGEMNPQRVFRGLQAGAFDYLTRPFEPWLLLSRVGMARRR